MSREKVTLSHVARLAGVSIITVSRVLNNKGRFSEATRARCSRPPASSAT
ncbi:LacI family DNA-binding transcriptional regulator [Meiothermus taiwanensis]|nr:LacI family DNA-binding transcriptional regulator [Meiothermus taiwanensis]